MALKRKLDFDAVDDFPQATKQLKMVPSPGHEPDIDVAMSATSSSDSELFPENHHTRLVSTTSSSSSSSGCLDGVDYSSPLYPRYGADQPTLDPSPAESPKVVGLLRPASTFTHHSTNCSRAPKLLVARSRRNPGDGLGSYHREKSQYWSYELIN